MPLWADKVILYEYPSKAGKLAKRREGASLFNKKRRLRRRLALSLVMSVAVFAIGLTADSIAARLVICLLAVLMAVREMAAAKLSFDGIDASLKEHTVITEDGFTHETVGFSGGMKSFEVTFSEVVRTVQSPRGELIISLKSGKELTVPFRAVKTKLFLINNLSEQLHYPKKNYRTIEEDEIEERDWFDRL